MNKRQLIQLGVPPQCVPAAQSCLQSAAKAQALRRMKPKKLIPKIVAAPASYVADRYFGELAKALLGMNAQPVAGARIDFRQWGDDIDEQSRQQMRNACRLPMAVDAALMPDAHVGYGLPIGGVLACEGAVVPYAVGVDIACRMRLTLTDLPLDVLERNDPQQCHALDQALQQGTRFGKGRGWDHPSEHPVMDEDWTISSVTRRMRDTAWRQLGTSGSGNHFVEWGVVALPSADLGLQSGQYVALLSHSGSRGAGAQVCRHFTQIAQRQLPYEFQHDRQLRQLAWLTLSSDEGQAYWAAMNLMGRYAAANHHVIHENVVQLAGAQALTVVENHHNFAWRESHRGRDLIVHRKGATPAYRGALGVIPGSMATPAFIVRGRGVDKSLHSAAHGAGRRMSRRAAKDQFRWHMWKSFLKQQNVRLLAGGLDEVPGAYKDIHEVMSAQADLVDIVGEFHPRIVMMCGDGSPAED